MQAPTKFLARIREETRLEGSTVMRDALVVAATTLPVAFVAVGMELRARRGNTEVFGLEVHSGVWALSLLVLMLGLIWFAFRRLRELDQAFAGRKALEHEIIQVAEYERTRIGQDLHDGLGQILTGIAFMSHALSHRLDKVAPLEAEEAQRIGELVKDAIRQTRELARGLYPVELSDNGLVSGLDALARGSKDLLGVRCRLNVGLGANVLDRGKALHFYRIAQEALDNAARHGKANEVRISLRRTGGKIVLSVEDDGTGIPPGAHQKGGLGLRIMQDRANLIGAEFHLGRGDRGGTIVRCRLDASQAGLSAA